MPDPGTYEDYCEHCEAERAIQETVPWQTDICTECAHPIEDD